MAHYAATSFDRRYDNAHRIPGWWRTGVESVREVVAAVARGRVSELARTPGGRPVHLVAYGEPEPHLRGSANFNSALGAGDPSAYYRKDERTRHVLFFMAGCHGHETEGIAGVLSLIRIMETGRDLRGRPQPELRNALDACRLLLVPLANPDGRARMPYESCIGLPLDEMHRVGQGTRRDGSNWGWPGCKTNHPMVGDVGTPGAYFDDDGVNLAHDEWTDPMSPVTAAIQRLVAAEGPDLSVSIHGHDPAHTFLPTAYLPGPARAAAKAYTDGAGAFCAARGFQVGSPEWPEPAADRMPSLNQASMLFHAGSSISLVLEVCHGLAGCGPADVTPDDTLEMLHAVFEYSAGARYGGPGL